MEIQIIFPNIHDQAWRKNDIMELRDVDDTLVIFFLKSEGLKLA